MRASLALVACLMIAFASASAHAEENEVPRLFDDRAVLAIDLEADWVAVQRDRDGTPEPRPATLTYAGPSGPVSIPLQIETRGRSRLSRDVCDFAPLRLLPKGKRVILGLVSTKTPQLESKDELKRKIEKAAQHVPLEQLGIGPQCGFSSGGGGGQAVTQDDTRRKLELVMEVARDVWG